jgi:multidrug efflux system outer membrane protein
MPSPRLNDMNRLPLPRTCVIASLLFLTLPLPGCTVGPDYRPPKVDAPEGWAGTRADVTAATQPSTNPATRPSVANQQPVDVAQWWTAFNDPVLNSLIDRAVQSNLDIRLAASRLRSARASRTVVAAGFWPTVDVTGSYRRTGSELSNGSNDLYRAGFDAAWELDVFGGVRRSIEASEADIQAAIEDRRSVLVSVAAEVALNYADLRNFQQRINIAKRNLEAQRHSADLTRKLFGGGFVAGLDVANAEAQVASTASGIPLLESGERQVIYTLSVLLAQEPAALLDELSVEAPLPATPPDVPVGLPSDLLRRRPDIRRAEAQLHAATAQIGVATSELFPKFSLTGSFGPGGSKPKSLVNWENTTWSIGPNVSWPLFDAGRIRANIEVQNAAQEQSLLSFRATVLTALQEVENALVAYAKEQQHRTALLDAVAANRRAVSIATQLYQQGQTDFLNVLSAQRSMFGSEDALAQSDRDVAADFIALYKALGGGWEGR